MKPMLLTAELVIAFGLVSLYWMYGVVGLMFVLAANLQYLVAYTLDSDHTETGFPMYPLLEGLWILTGLIGLYGILNLWWFLVSMQTERFRKQHVVYVLLGIYTCIHLSITLSNDIDWTNSSDILTLVIFLAPVLCAVHFLALMFREQTDNKQIKKEAASGSYY